MANMTHHCGVQGVQQRAEGNRSIHSVVRLLFLLLVSVALSGCAVVGGIFKSGVAVGIFVAVVIIVVLLMLFGRR